MLEVAPHTLYRQVATGQVLDRYGRVVTPAATTWEAVGPCFCHDNSQDREASADGRRWAYRYHVVYEGPALPTGQVVRCLDEAGQVVGEGRVTRFARCFGPDFANRNDIWI